MKTIQLFLVGSSLLASVASFAGVGEGAGTWSGKGVVFGADGKKISGFGVAMVSEAVGDKLKSKITVVADGKTETIQQTLRDAGPDRFTIESDQGNGGGYCFGQGLCEAYTGTKAHGFAITIVLDSPDRRRMLVTELQDGKAVKFVRESMERLD